MEPSASAPREQPWAVTTEASDVPTATYRLQLTPQFGFDDAAAVAPYLAELGVSHLYLSPILEAVSGSMHGYDVVDHDRLRTDFGGAPAFDRLARAAHDSGLGVVVDVVPNHMAIPTPESQNRPLWDTLRAGSESAYAHWFDIDWAAQDGRLLLPVLGDPLEDCLERGELTLDTAGREPIVRYFDHEFPVRSGTASLPLGALLGEQHYRLDYWRDGTRKLNYRRFFDVSTMIAVRVEEPDVFSATHALLLALLREGAIDGLRIDHPDGLADPRGYLRQLAAATDGAWVVVEKILEGPEELPADWVCAGTTGYDSLNMVGGLFVDAPDIQRVRETFVRATGSPADFDEVAEASKRVVVRDVLPAEIARLAADLRDIARAEPTLGRAGAAELTECVTELLIAIDRYRAYVVPGEPAPAVAVEVLEQAADRARHRLTPATQEALGALVDVLLGRSGRDGGGARDDVIVRFQQTCGPVMAKGLEDTAFYRWFPLASLAEVGGDPASLGVTPAAFAAFCGRLQRDWPATMTTLSTHDTKRSEDVRARLAALSRRPDEWARLRAELHEAGGNIRPEQVDAPTEYLLLQTAVGAWPITGERLATYALKAVREAKVHTSWTNGDPAYERAVEEFARTVVDRSDLVALIETFVAALQPDERAICLAQKLVQLTMPGVPDVYQGCELPSYALVDPDNRRGVDYRLRERLLAGAALPAATKPLDLEKLRVTRTVLQLRREHADWFGATAPYEALPTTSAATLAYTRGEHLVVAVPLRGATLDPADVTLPRGSWTPLLPDLPVLLLAR